MQIRVKGKNIEVTEALREHAVDKVSKIQKLGLEVREIEVTLLVEKNPSIRQNQLAEINIFGNSGVIRAVGRDRDMYIAIDQAVAKVQRQMSKYHGKQIDRTQAHPSALRTHTAEEHEEEDRAPSIVKLKGIPRKPMTPEEAVLQMETLGHDFFVFTNSETDNTNIVYRRIDGNYGLLDYGVID
ncbi:MAG TPA: ribosome-associated translation inhibitor RaiA [Candidatus Anoxymicrobiaceae bacterium]